MRPQPVWIQMVGRRPSSLYKRNSQEKKGEWQSNEFCYFFLQLYDQFSRYSNGERIPATIVVIRSTGNSFMHHVSAQVHIIATPVSGHRLGSWIEHLTLGVQRQSGALTNFYGKKQKPLRTVQTFIRQRCLPLRILRQIIHIYINTQVK